MSYYTVHRKLKDTRGRASSLDCYLCGKRARDWAYQHTSSDEKVDPRTGRVYSDDPRDYEPMCRACHRQRDLLRQESVRSAAEAGGKRVGEATAKRWRENPEAAHAQRSAAGKIGIRAAHERIREDPELREKHAAGARRNGVKARAALRKKLDDPEESARIRALQSGGGRRGGGTKRRCLACGVEMNAGAMGMHQKHSGHTGWGKA